MGIWKQEEVITQALHQCVPHPRSLKSGSWEFTLVNGKPFQVEARIENDWLVFETDAADPQAANWWSLLELNQKLGVSTKFVLRPRTNEVNLRSELLLFAEIDLLRRLNGVRDELVAAMGLVHKLNGHGKRSWRRHTVTRQSDAIARSAPEVQTSQSLKELCEQSGWPGTERPDGSVAIDLEVAQAFHQAIVVRDNQGYLRLTSELLAGELSQGDRRSASAQLLLCVSALLRLARAEAVEIPAKPAIEGGEQESGYALYFAALLADDAKPVELHEALANLSMAFDLAGRETGAMREPRLAARYLQITNGMIETATVPR